MSEYNKLEDGSFVDYESGKKFQFDHVNNKPSEWEDYEVESEVASTMYFLQYVKLIASSSITKPLGAYVLEHYPALPAYAVYPPSPSSSSEYTILIVGNKYNNPNYWYFLITRTILILRNGRWRSIYKYDPHAKTLKGTVTITVHYFEDGNVLLKTNHEVDKTDLSSSQALVKAIAEDEKAYQEELARTFGGLGDGVFKGLRRLLPVTKQKIEWERVAQYKLKPGQLS